YRLYSVVQGDSSTAISESEPNDTIGNADSGSINYFAGALSAASDIDMFAFTAAPGDLLVIQLDGDPLRNNTPINGALALLSSTGAVLVAVNDFNATSSTGSGAGTLSSTS